MLVKRLEIQGFKSFAERVVIDFGPGVSGIIGANGAGKSNVADAVRWVLGEQNPRHLRCSRMEELIFSGSGTRRPLGFAEVVLVLENEQGRLPLDFTEVSITRRLYRSGESEYLINGAAARLKDIGEILAETGLGREGYSIVGQGRIDEILMGAPEIRRGLFDEACGIGVHRVRKRDALGRLDDVAARLERVSDVVGELRAQAAPLEEQASVARSFVAYRDELDRLELWLEALEMTRLRARVAACRARLAEAQAESGVLSARERRLEEEIGTLRTAFTELGELLEQRRRETALSEAARRETVAKIRALEEKVANCRREMSLVEEESRRLASRSERLISHRVELRSAAEARSVRLTEARETLAETEVEQAAIQERLSAAREALERARGDLNETLTAGRVCGHELATAKAALARLREEEGRARREAESGREALSRLGAEIEAVSVELAAVEEECERARGLLARLEERQTSLEMRAAELARRSEEERGAVGELEISKSGLEATLALGSTWSRSALAAVAAARSRERADQGFVGVLGEEIEAVPEARSALGAALGRHADAVVVRTEDDLRRYMDHLQREGVGPAVLVSTDLVREHLTRVRSREIPDGLVPLTSAVTCRQELEPVVRFFLGDTVLCETFEAAREAVISGGARRAVCLDGVLLRAGGVVSVGAGAGPGGAEVADGSSLDRRRLLREVRDELTARKEVLRAVETERLAVERDLAGTTKDRSALAARFQDLALKRATLTEKVASGRAREAGDRQRVDVAVRELPGLAGRIAEAETAMARSEESLKALAGREKTGHTAVEEMEAVVRLEVGRQEEAVRRAGEGRVLVAGLEAQDRAARSEEERLREEIERLEREAIQYRQRLARLASEKDESEADLGPLRETLARGTAQTTGHPEDPAAWPERRDKMSADLQARERELSAVRAARAEAGGRERREETRLARLETEEEMILRRLRRDHGDEWERKAVDRGPAQADLGEDEAFARVEELRRALGGLGVVNIGAIEEHRRLEDRVAFLTGQSRDLLEARESLLKLIAEIDETMAGRFEEGFLVVRRAFKERIAQLFGGGTGELVLSDRDDLLGSGVEIMVQPPGKRVQSLALLSAGERALAALALLLSFLESRPCPCVVLDEIDAPLDDTNVSRFSAALRDLSGGSLTQFIVVTHNKATMEIAEALYGVTMGDDGVSRLVSVKMNRSGEKDGNLVEEAG